MARQVFFSFHYKYVWKVNQIRSIPNITGTAAAGFSDASLWEEAKKKGDAKIKGMIDDALDGTSVTVAFITEGSINRKFINYEIDRSLARGNGLVAVQIHHLENYDGTTGNPGTIPPKITDAGFKAYKYVDSKKLATWIEEAAELAGR